MIRTLRRMARPFRCAGRGFRHGFVEGLSPWEPPEVPPVPLTTPSIITASLPKSGTVYLSNLMREGLRYAAEMVSHGYFPVDLIDWKKLVEHRAGAVVSSHLDPSPTNLKFLAHFQPRIHVHIRDPRQAALSMAHHLAKYQREKYVGYDIQTEPAPPPEFHEWPLAGQIDWMLAEYLPNCVTWIGDWLAILDSGVRGIDILLTTYEEMLADERGLIQRILAFFGVPESAYTWPTVPKTMAAHFRQGTPDEWRHVFTPEQQERATALVPSEWRERFLWG